MKGLPLSTGLATFYIIWSHVFWIILEFLESSKEIVSAHVCFVCTYHLLWLALRLTPAPQRASFESPRPQSSAQRTSSGHSRLLWIAPLRPCPFVLVWPYSALVLFNPLQCFTSNKEDDQKERNQYVNIKTWHKLMVKGWFVSDPLYSLWLKGRERVIENVGSKNLCKRAQPRREKHILVENLSTHLFVWWRAVEVVMWAGWHWFEILGQDVTELLLEENHREIKSISNRCSRLQTRYVS